MSNKRTYPLLWRFLADNRNCRTYTSFEKKYLLLYLFQVWLLIHRKKRGLTNYYIMHFKKKITVEELAGTCTSSSTIHGYLDELKRRNSISIEICPYINKKARARATCSILRAYPDFYNMKRLRVVTPPPLDRLLLHRKVTLQHLIRLPWQFTGTYLYSWVERQWELSVLPKNTTQWPNQGPISRRSR